MARVLKERGNRVKAIVLFGCMAKGNYGFSSDYDLFIIAEEEGDLLERIERYSRLVRGGVEAFVYTPSEAEKMMQEYHLLLLDALKDGIALFDTGVWSPLHASLRRLVSQGKLRPALRGWDIAPKQTYTLLGGTL